MKKMLMMCAVVVGLVAHAEPTITDVTAQQRYPWNGKVDISYRVKNVGMEARGLFIWAADRVTGITNVAMTVTGDTAYTSGQHHVVWDMAADGLTLASTNVVFLVSYESPLYCVIDLSGGTSATSYPVTYLDAVPSGGWSDEYKTSKLVLRKIPAGTFTMGSPVGELGRQGDEAQHRVTLTKDYYMGVFPMTQRQWELVMGTRPSYFNNDDYYAPRPVECVSYDMIRGSSAGAGWPNSSDVDSTSFLGVLRAKSGLQLDLPTEAQWEYACRAGTTTALNSGKNQTNWGQDPEMDKVGRYRNNGGSGGESNPTCDWSKGTAKVGSYVPNAWGLYDMHGNVCEWCLDWYGSFSGDATDPKGPSSGSYRMLRGLGWANGTTACRSACRAGNIPSYKNYGSCGFRLVRTLLRSAAGETAARNETEAATSGGSDASGVSDPVRIDLTPGIRTAAPTETITYSTEWVEGAGVGAVAVVSVNGEVVSQTTGSGIVDWAPKTNGAYVLTHRVLVGGEQIGETLSANFQVNHLPCQIKDVAAQQRYPWNGKVDISFSVEEAGTDVRELFVWAVDQTTGITNVANAVVGDTAYTNGLHHVIWDMSADGLTFVSTNVVFTVTYKEKIDGLYCVIDLSGGTSASSFPVTYLDVVPVGGWSDEFKTTKLVLRKISAGTFTMGSPAGELGRRDKEIQHEVTLTKDYFVGIFQVTQRQWELVMGTRPGYFNRDACYASRPIEQISYNMIRGSSAGAGWPNSSDVDATSFLGVLRAKSGLQLDLPTEAQWEYACRAGTTTALNSGKNLTSTEQDAEMNKVGRYRYNGGSVGESYPACDWSGGTAKVGSYVPNAWGLFDMHGNVWEWCLDWSGSYSGDATDPKGPSSGSDRVVRGGSWIDPGADYCRSACRGNVISSRGLNSFGFRLVRTLSEDAVAEIAVMSVDASGQGESNPVRIDLTSGTRTTEKTETLTYSTSWVVDAGVGAVAVVAVDDDVISEASGSGMVEWMPEFNGMYVLTHKVIVGGEQIGETLTATFVVTNRSKVVFAASGYDGAYDGTGHGISVDVADPAEGAVVTYSRTQEGEFTTLPILFTNVTDDAQSVYFKITADGYQPTSGVETVRVTAKTLTADMIGAIADRVYTGEAHRPEVTVSDVPPCVITEDDYTVEYADNVYAGVGRAIVTGKGNYTGVAEKTFVIQKANYDMSHVAWDNVGRFTYDGKQHEVKLQGLPSGVVPTYQGNAATAAGSYVASATLSYDTRNYNPPPSIAPNSWGIDAKGITVSAVDAGSIYGEPDAPLTYNASGLVGSDTLSGAPVRAPGADVGTYPITIGTLGNPNYSITFNPGVYTISPRPVTLTSGSAEKKYDGAPLTNPEVAVSGSGWASGEGATYDVTGSQTEVGESTNTFTYALLPDTKAENYAVTKVEGTLRVLPNPKITDVTAQQRYPWNGKVDISYTLSGAKVETRGLSVWAVDEATGITNIAKSVTGDVAYTNGQHHVVWDMGEDGLMLVSTNVVFGVSYVESPLYCVIDLSGGTSASSYPVSYLADVPEGGWSDDFKTTKLVLRKIPAGTFTMGSPTDELGRQGDEVQHQVTMTKEHYIGVFPVTQRQWELVMGTRPSYFNNNACYASRPVEQVSYNMIRGSSAGVGWPNSSDVDSTSFLGVLRAKSGLVLDLPTEAQWEYACRAGTITALNNGKNLTSTEQDAEADKVGRYWYNGGSSYPQSVDTRGATAKVGSYAPNAWGLYDMHGNVVEWCLDWYGSYSGDATDPKGSSSGSERVIRGGSWYIFAGYCRSAHRYAYPPAFGYNNIGFRLVRTLSEGAAAETTVKSDGAVVEGFSDPVRVDLTSGTRVAEPTEAITYSTEWSEDAGEGAVAVVSVNGQVISEAQGSGTVDWTPEFNGTYELLHKVMVGGEQVGETFLAKFKVTHLSGPEITDVTAQQRYPWNGKVDISYVVENVGAEEFVLSVSAVDQTTGITNVARSVTGDVAYTNGQHHIVWDMAADGLTFVSTNVVFSVSYAEPLRYCVIDLSGGTSASSYPVSYLADVPEGGWSDDFKTTKLVLRKISAGTFTMGSPEDELGRDSDETQHQVGLTKDYYMGIFQVAQRQWELVMGTRPSYFNNDAYYAPRPVEQISYDMIRGSSAGAGWPNSSTVDATSFLGVLCAKSGLQLDLPTEAQWEYACRAGTTTALNSGKNLTGTSQDPEMDKVGRHWCNGGSSGDSGSDWRAGTAKVGSYAPNAWGLYDMHGNVGEWCLDWYGSYSGEATDPKGSSSGPYRVVRGASWRSIARGCRSACRDHVIPSDVSSLFGFRLVRTLSDAVAETTATSGSSGAYGESDPVRIDLTSGTRTTDTTETLTYSTHWVEDAGEDAIVEIAANGVVFSTQLGSGTVAWRPKYDGTYELSHTVKTNGVAVGETLTATFVAEGVSPKRPVISPESGTTFDTSLTVSMTCESEDATIRYTLDGSEPTMASAAYKRKFKIYGITTVKAIAFWEDGTPSEMTVADYSKGYCAEPVVTAPSEFVGSKAKVVMDCATEGATIYYTMDGTDPNLQSPVYTKPLIVTNDCTIKAYAAKFDFTPSEIVTFVITRQWGIGDTLGKPDHMFETGGDADFVRVVDETAALGESMRSGVIEDNQRSVLMTTLIGPGTLKFKWKTSCEKDDEYEWDHAEFRVNGIIRGRLNGVTDWVEVSQRIAGKGTNTVTWTYVKDPAEFEGEDCLWVSEYVWESDYTETQTTGVPVPYLWLEEKCSDVVDEFESYEKVAKQKALNKRLTVEQCYVAGVDPESLTQDFTTSISMEGGFPTVTWDPDLGVLREYKVWGRESLMSGDWQYPTNSTHRFFKVTVEMK